MNECPNHLCEKEELNSVDQHCKYFSILKLERWNSEIFCILIKESRVEEEEDDDESSNSKGKKLKYLHWCNESSVIEAELERS